MKILVAAAAAASALALAAPASAEIYGSLGYSSVEGGDARLDAVTARLSWKSSTPFGIEGEASTGVGDDKIGATKVELNSEYALYGTATVQASEAVQLFARVGFAGTNVKLNPGGGVKDNSTNYGIGGQWFFAGANGVRFDYTRFDYSADADLSDTDVYSVSYVRKF